MNTNEQRTFSSSVLVSKTWKLSWAFLIQQDFRPHFPSMSLAGLTLF